MKALAGWQNFYVIIGSSAGALIGLQFVVLSLIASRPRKRVDEQAGRAFSTPTIMHFSAVLALAALLTAPWEGAAAPTLLWGGVGAVGVMYAAMITRRIRRQTAYRLELEDWLFFVLLPFVAYGGLTLSAITGRRHVRESLFGVAAAVLLLLMIGIHNAWDAVTYHVFQKSAE